MNSTQGEADPGWGWLQRPWWFVSNMFRALMPARFSLLVAVVGGVVFLGVPQGIEVLRSLAEGDQYSARFGFEGNLRIFFFGVALLLWAFNSWYWARVLLNACFHDSLPTEVIRQNPVRWLRRQGPRILGVAPLAIVAAAFFAASYRYESDAPGDPRLTLWVMGASCLVLALLFYVFCIQRRRWLDARGEHLPGEAAATVEKDEATDASDQRFQSLHHLWEQSVETFWAVSGLALFSIFLLVLFTIAPVVTATTIGSGAILLCAASTWVSFGSLVVYLSGRYRLPFIGIFLVVAALCSIINDNHAVRLLHDLPPATPIAKGAATGTEGPIAQAFIAWHKGVQSVHPATVRPVFIVAAPGGGIRAAYWTATVLSTLEDQSLQPTPSSGEPTPDFASHLFAISGVSGGSLGAAVFDALLAEKQLPPNQTFTSESEGILGEDFLSPTLASMLFPDLLQRFLPWPMAVADRGAVLEEAWEQGWRTWLGPSSDRFAQPLRALWLPDTSPAVRSGGHVPALFLNGTAVGTGKRVVVCSLPIGDGPHSELIDVEDVYTMLGNNPSTKAAPDVDMRLSTAAHLSARFTYVSPAGLLPNNERVVDGGYFENSGAATALEILRVVQTVLSERQGKPDWPDQVNPVVLLLDNAPAVIPLLTPRVELPRKVASPAIQTAKAKAERPKPYWQEHSRRGYSIEFLGELLDPLRALMQTRDARGSFSEAALNHEAKSSNPAPLSETNGVQASHPDQAMKSAATSPQSPPFQVLKYRLGQRRVPLPLGWMLSGGAAIEMREQIDTDELENKANVKEVLRMLRDTNAH